MARIETVQVEAARIPDRDRLIEALRQHGLDAQPVDEVGIEVPCGEDSEQACDELYGHVETLVLAIGEPFVPAKRDGTIYLRPPSD